MRKKNPASRLKSPRLKNSSCFFLLLSLTLLLPLEGCGDARYEKHRDKLLEERIRTFYSSDLKRLDIQKIMGEFPIDSYCLLLPYQTDIYDKNDLADPVNKFLKEINMQSEEAYWHIVTGSENRYFLLRLAQHKVPLLTPASYLASSCFTSKSIIITKDVSNPGGRVTLKIGG